MTRHTLTLLCGIPGSGKSFLTDRLAGMVVSTDALRKFLWGHESVVKHDRLVFDIAKSIIEYVLRKTGSVVMDATNLTRRRRQTMIDIALRHQAGVTVIWIDCPLEVALARNAARDRKVPVPVIKALHKSIEEPELNEGIDIIKVLNADKQFIKIICPRGILVREKYLIRQEWPGKQRNKKIKI